MTETMHEEAGRKIKAHFNAVVYESIKYMHEYTGKDPSSDDTKHFIEKYVGIRLNKIPWIVYWINVKTDYDRDQKNQSVNAHP